MPKATSPKPYTGVSIRVQLRPRVHRALKVRLAQEGQTITGWLHAMVAQALEPTPCPLADACPLAAARQEVADAPGV